MSSREVVTLVREAIAGTAAAHSTHVGDTWLTVRPHGVDLPEHGWKLHLSSRAANFPDLLEKVLPILLAERCHFKMARSWRTLVDLNEGFRSPAAVGKAVTVYPPASRVRELGLVLAGTLRGHEGPRVLSDRRVDPRAPVFYRYGPFVPRWHVESHGELTIGIPGPDGSTFDGAATLEYRQPEWVTDPFKPTDAQDAGEPLSTTLLAGRYDVTRGIYRSAHGNVYRAVDTETGRTVVVKQARAFVAEALDGSDARAKIRNERRVLTACSDTAGIPAVIDHFAHGDDEFLVTTDVGDTNLLYHVSLEGPFLPAGSSGDSARRERFLHAVNRLASIVHALHEHGVIMRDVTPRNIVVDDGELYLVDFGISAYDGFHLSGGTSGFAPETQMKDGVPRLVDDCHALGMTLAYLAAARLPVPGVTTPGLAREQTIASLSWIYGGELDGFLADVDALLSEEETQAASALARLADPGWQPTRRRRRQTVHRKRPGVSADTVVELVERQLGVVLEQVLPHQLEAPGHEFPTVDASVYTGSAGIGLELLHHRGRAGVDDVVARLAAHAMAVSSTVDRDAGLYAGATGIDLFLDMVASAGIAVDGYRPRPAPRLTWSEIDALGDDIMVGVAGLGLACLFRHDVTGRTEHLHTATACAEYVLGHGDMAMSVDPDNKLPASAATEQSFGFAHGLAGVVGFLLAYMSRSQDGTVPEETRGRADRLRVRADELAVAARTPAAVPLSTAWCQGLSGIGRVLLHAGTVLSDSTYTRSAVTAMRTVASWVPRLENLNQCCGAAGVGSALIDTYTVTDDEYFLDAAYSVVDQLLLRSRTPVDAPTFVDPDGQDAPVSWGMGNAGLLSFLRRLADPSDPDILPNLCVVEYGG